MANLEQVREILQDVKVFVNRPENNYSWSSWEDGADAVQEIDGYLAELNDPARAARIFLPTGPLQELSLSSGWGDEFCGLADRFDLALACDCMQERRSDLRFTADLMCDKNFGEVSVLECPGCRQLWVHYLYEDESITASGRWFECWLNPAEYSALTAASALEILKSKSWHYFGGSYFGGEVGKSSGPVIVS